MFANAEDARARLAQHFDAETAARIVAALQPCIGFDPVETHDPSRGATRFGGEPDLPQELVWPLRSVPDDLEEMVQRGGPNSIDRLRYHLGQALPLPFVAQIDLAEAAALGDVASPLPSDGRLLFFYDTASGPWCVPGSCRVIFDQTAQALLKRAERPATFTEMEAKAREFAAADLVATQQNAAAFDYDAMRKVMRDAGLDAKNIEEQIAAIRDVMGPEVLQEHRGAFVSPFQGPAQPMRLVSRLAIPQGFSVEVQSDPKLREIVELLSEQEPIAGWDRSHDDALHQLLGIPTPEQDDPRGELFERGDREWPDILALAKDWRLLLQVSMHGFAPKVFGEGTVYFLIRNADLQARNFDNVEAVYQQT